MVNPARYMMKKADDDGDRDGDDGDEGRAPVAQEQEDDQRHQAEGDEQRVRDLLHGAAHEGGEVVADAGVDVGRDLLLQDLHAPVELVGDGDGVGVGLGDDH